ncbi:hypothetical protein [Salegentibacter salarius]|uniref:Uncharacterized protein n=1 Tax=Salegentibacter salarius TaxID=435906 RepID=A0A2N0TV12_9FLAO|nr:hypothetical protein [Salegentibacter salarius]OEY72258.1 hypothetical protein BHS39_03165 [Salegentibacter salarius]PKD18579.1 hypothetical protein APR40_03165 [Salegentibacter salarius]SLJ88381.1 hypothetical protein SAMN05660445_00643 [Salegentibacter salarius]
MKNDKLKEKIIAYIDNADKDLLNRLSEVIENYKEKETVAYTIDGQSLSRKEYLEQLKAAENEIKKGDFISQKNLEKEVNTW